MDEGRPTTPLQAARQALGWKQSRVLTALAIQAKADSVSIAAPASLKTMLSRWENGAGQPDATYQRLFCRIYDRAPQELGFVDVVGSRGSTRLGPVVAAETVEYFASVFDQHLKADQLMGPQHLVDVVRAQADLLDRILPDAKPGQIRNELLSLSSRYNEFTGWLYQDSGDTDSALTFTDRAIERAVALDDVTNMVYLLMRKCNIICDRGSADRAVNLADGAAQLLHKVSPKVRALLLAQQARAHALRGSEDSCARSLDAAMREVSRPGGDVDPFLAYSTPEYIAMEAATCWATLTRSAKAIPVLERALTTWPAPQRRDLGLCQARLATAYAHRGDAERAAQVGRDAVLTVRLATSARTLRELGRVRDTLIPWRREPSVAETISLIKGLNHSA